MIMTVKELATQCNLTVKNLGNPETELSAVYCCDLLSIVMGKAPAGAAWVTIMGNMNSVAVASLAEIGVIVLADGVQPDQNALQKAAENDINLLTSAAPIFETALAIHQAISA